MKKRRQHYVFQAYLSAWANQDGQLYCMRNRKNIFCTGTENIAQERDFYRVLEINNDEEKFLRWFWQGKNENVRNKLFEHLNVYQLCYIWETELKIIGKIRECAEYINLNDPKAWNEIKALEEKLVKLVDEAQNNLEEDFMSGIEGEFIEYIKAFINEDLNLLAAMNKDEFFLALSIQYFRTKALRERLAYNFKTCLKDPRYSAIKEFKRENVRVENIMHMLIWDYQSAVADSLLRRNAHITLLINDTGTPFITCDQPVINLCADYENLQLETKDLIFYYPLSPRTAITVKDNNSVKKLNITTSEVENYNAKIVCASYESIFASDKNILMKYCN